MRLLPSLAALTCLTGLGAPQPLTLDEVLFRANEAVIAYERALSRAVAEERTTQRLVRADGTVTQERSLVADLVLIRLGGDEAWIGYRDVREVDGTRLRPADGRLLAIVAPATQEALQAAEQITNESAKQYLREFWRNVNLPTTGLTFLHTLNQHRFRFEKTGEEPVSGVPTWRIDFTEHVQPTLIRSGAFDIFARGTVWIEPDTGRLARSRVLLGDFNTAFRSEVTVTFRPDEALGLWVPIEARERHENPRDPSEPRLESETTYVDFRPFAADEYGR